MYQYTVYAHSILRWIILILLIVNLVKHLSSFNVRFTRGDRKLALVLMIFAHIQLLLGLYQWFAGNTGIKLVNAMGGMAKVMKDAAARFWVVEHTTAMVIAIILITVANSVSKKKYIDSRKHKRMALLYFIALLLILAAVPWPIREAASRPLWPSL
ncbi:MAG: hypothetical protein JWN76_2112 [Chitinophagaceae bacterium]|nr:hypothetical protein [Chitinophagaceae bacterium]